GQSSRSGSHGVRAQRWEPRETAAFAALNERFKAQSMRLARVRGQIMPVMRVAASLGTLVVLCYGGSEVIDGRLSLGDLVAFIGYLNLLAWPTMAMGWMLSVVQRGRAAMNRLDHIFAITPEIGDAPDATPLPAVRGRIEFRDVDFAYRVAGMVMRCSTACRSWSSRARSWRSSDAPAPGRARSPRCSRVCSTSAAGRSSSTGA